MGVNKNDCLDCDNCYSTNDNNNKYICSKGNTIPKDERGYITVFENDCKDFDYQK